MGLAGRKQKQRIPADPRNLSWADDASRFGLSYLSKFGWDASQGLGASGDGMKTHLKVEQKLDMMGIGAQHQRDPNGIAWKQNKEFEALLKRLNESAGQGRGADEEDTKGLDGSGCEMEISPKTYASAQEEKVEEAVRDESAVTTVKKRKSKDRDHSDANENTRKKQKKEKHEKSRSDISAIPSNSDSQSAASSSRSKSESTPKPRPMAHRARLRAAKRIAGKSESAISEILGIAPSSSVSTSTSTPVPTPPSSSTPVPQPNSLSLDILTTSAKSVADYFKEKLLARTTTSPTSSSSAPSGSATPGLGATSPGTRSSNTKVPPPDDEGEPSRRGIGSQAFSIPPPPQVFRSESVSASGDDGGNADGRDPLTEKLLRKAERKAEKRRRRGAEAKHPIPENVPAVVQEQVGKDHVEGVQRVPKKEKSMKRRQERKEQVLSNFDDDDGVTEKSHEHDTLSSSLPELDKKSRSKKEHKKKRP